MWFLGQRRHQQAPRVEPPVQPTEIDCQRWRTEGMNAREANVLLAWHDLIQGQRDHAFGRVSVLERELRYARAELQLRE